MAKCIHTTHMGISTIMVLLILSVTSLQAFQEDWKTSRLSSEPDFVTPIQNVTMAASREAVLTCTVNNLGKYKVAWVRAEDQTILSLHTKVVTHNNRVSVTHDDPETWKLRIRPVKESDRGCYLCQINTPVLKSQKGCLDVFVPPDILNENTSGDMSISEGENTTLSCIAAGHPTPRINWRREDGQPILIRKGLRDYEKVEVYSGTHMHFWRLDRRQMGAYLCIASNDIPPAVSKRISLSVNFAPVIKVPNQLLGAPVSTDVRLECFVEAYPNTINYWIKNRGEMLLNGSKYTIREQRSGYKVVMWLEIRSFSPSDIGTYNCVSTNSLGRAEGTLRLYEIKVGPIPPHHNQVILGGLAEPARGHRSSRGTSTTFITPPALMISLSFTGCFLR
ncbi:lachesin [Leptinotarsa decemlineata]|uniref:lachesin n=1 Tax=Leptinotarsa decemlineata TaxID=7539 RepID=UPI003D308658